MKKDIPIKLSFINGYVLLLLGVFLKINHEKNAGLFLKVGIISSIVYFILAIYEIRTSNRIDSFEKKRWTIGFIFMTGLAGLLYFFVGRKKIA